MATVGEILVRLGLDISDFEKKLANTTKSFKDTGEQLQKIGTTLSVAITAPLTAIGGLAIKSAMENEKASRIFRTTFGDMSNSAQEWVTNFNKVVKDNESDIQELLGRFNILFKNFGIGRESALQMAQGMTKLAYDMSSFFGMPIDESFEKIRGAMMGMSRGMKQLGIDIEDTTVKEEAFRRGIIKQGEELTEAQMVALRYTLLMEKIGFVHDSTAKMVNTAEGQFRILKAQTKELAESLGAILIPVANEVLKVILKLIEMAKGIITQFQGLPAPVKTIALAIGGLVVALGPLLAGLGTAIKLFGSLTSTLAGIPPILKTASIGFMGVAGAIGALGTALILGTQAWINYESKQISAIYQSMTATKTISELSRAIGKGYSEEREELKRLMREYKNFDDVIKAIAKGEGGTGLKKLLESIQKETKATSTSFEGLKFSMKELFDSVIKEGAKTTKEAMKETQETITTTTTAITDLINSVQAMSKEREIAFHREEPLRKLWLETEKGFFENLKTINEEGNEAIRSAWEIRQELQRESTQLFFQSIQDIFTNATATILMSLEQWAEGNKKLGDVLKDIWTSIKESIVKALFDIAMAAVRSAMQTILAEKARAIASALAKIFASIPFPASLALAGTAIAAITALFAKLHLAEGGLVTAPALAMIAERGPEVVIPLEKLKMFEGRKVPPIVNVYFNNYSPISSNMDIDRIAERLGTMVSNAIMKGRR